MDDKKNKTGLNVNIDPIRTPILYADAIRVNAGENGVVLDIAQTVAGTPQAIVVSRIGLSREHAEKLAKAIIEQISKKGVFVTGSAKIIN